jgi:hypothetical protein
MIPRHLLALSAGVLLGATSLSADTLILQDGRRITGELVSANQTTVVFDARPDNSRRQSSRMRLDKAQVQRIVFNDQLQNDDDDGTIDPFGSVAPYGRNGGRTGGRNGGRTDGRNDGRNDTYGRNEPYGRDDSYGRDETYGNDQLGRGDRQVSVDATRQWTDTGINVTAGETIYFTADGAVIWGQGRQDTAAGEYNSPYNRNRPIPGRPAGALIGRIGTSVFFIGDETGAFRVNNTGRLYLGINDDVLQDNSGSFRVSVRR